MSSLGGTLSLAALDALTGRDRHRPQTREEMRVAIFELRQRGMDDHSIARATHLSVEQVRRMLGESSAT